LGSTLATWPLREVPLVKSTLTVRPIKADAIVATLVVDWAVVLFVVLAWVSGYDLLGVLCCSV
jgi:hypothetical protein